MYSHNMSQWVDQFPRILIWLTVLRLSAFCTLQKARLNQIKSLCKDVKCPPVTVELKWVDAFLAHIKTVLELNFMSQDWNFKEELQLHECWQTIVYNMSICIWLKFAIYYYTNQNQYSPETEASTRKKFNVWYIFLYCFHMCQSIKIP